MLEQSLLDFPGAVVLASHDRSFLDTLATGIIGFDNHGNAEHFASSSQWARAMATRGYGLRKEKNQKTGQTKTGKRHSRKNRNKTRAGLSYREKQELKGMEEKILAAEQRLEECQQMAAAPETAKDAGRLARWCARLDSCQQEVDALYARWEELERKKDGS